MELEWTEPALDDLEDIRDHIGKDSPYYARRFIERIFDAIEKLQDHPRMGRPVPEADQDDVRELIFQGYPGSSTGPSQTEYRSSPSSTAAATWRLEK